MRSIYLYSILLTIISLCSCSKNEEGVLVRVRLEGNTQISDVKMLIGDEEFSLSIDSKGSGDTLLPVNMGFGVLEYNKCRIPIYVGEDNFDVTLNVVGNSLKPGFNGKGAKKNYYMSNVRRRVPDYTLPTEQFMSQLEDNLKAANHTLDSMKLGSEFSDMERVRLRYLYMSALSAYPIYNAAYTNNDSLVMPDSYYEKLNSLIVGNKDWLSLQEYRDGMVLLVNRVAFKDTENDSPLEVFVKQLTCVKKNVSDANVASYLGSFFATRFVKDRGIDDVSIFEPLVKSLVTDSADYALYSEACSSWKALSPGCNVPGLNGLTDKNGKSYTWEDFAGKYVYVSCWLTFSDPAVESMRNVQKLRKEFASDSIVFLSICGDGTDKDFEKVSRQEGFGGIQLLAARNRTFLDSMQVSIYPRFILIDKNGKIIRPIAMSPETDDISAYLGSLPGLKNQSVSTSKATKGAKGPKRK